MKLSYYPGCTLKTKAKDLDRKARACAEKLGVALCEIPEWQCCGGCYPLGKDEIAAKLSACRALQACRETGGEIVTVCSACHNVLKRVGNDLATDEVIRDRVNRYLAPETPLAGEEKVIHYVEMLRDKVGFDKVKEAVTHPLTGRKTGAYYGCLLLRPGKVMAFDDPENPRILEDLLTALGADAVVWPCRNECCSGYVALEDDEAAKAQSRAVLEDAAAHGIETLVTACPLCLYNLKRVESPVKVVYFTELLAEALGIGEEEDG